MHADAIVKREVHNDFDHDVVELLANYEARAGPHAPQTISALMLSQVRSVFSNEMLIPVALLPIGWGTLGRLNGFGAGGILNQSEHTFADQGAELTHLDAYRACRYTPGIPRTPPARSSPPQSPCSGLKSLRFSSTSCRASHC